MSIYSLITDARQHSTILAALRFWQREGLLSGGHEHDIATLEGRIEALTAEEIDALCEQINCAEPPVVVAQVEGGAVHGVSSNAPVRLVILDSDTEGADEECVIKVDGHDVYLIERTLDVPAGEFGEGIDIEYVSSVLDQIAAQEGGI